MIKAPAKDTLIVISPCRIYLALTKRDESHYLVGVAANWYDEWNGIIDRELDYAYDWAEHEGFGQVVCGQWQCPDEVKTFLDSIQ